MNTTRSSVINSVIENGNRVSKRATRNGYRTLYSCDVCWTCKYFKVENKECILSYEDAKKRDKEVSSDIAPEFLATKDYFIPVLITRPSWFRCAWWEENE